MDLISIDFPSLLPPLLPHHEDQEEVWEELLSHSFEMTYDLSLPILSNYCRIDEFWGRYWFSSAFCECFFKHLGYTDEVIGEWEENGNTSNPSFTPQSSATMTRSTSLKSPILDTTESLQESNSSLSNSSPPSSPGVFLQQKPIARKVCTHRIELN